MNAEYAKTIKLIKRILDNLKEAKLGAQIAGTHHNGASLSGDRHIPPLGSK